jgi:polyisoprenoid-binding protein YceI
MRRSALISLTVNTLLMVTMAGTVQAKPRPAHRQTATSAWIPAHLGSDSTSLSFTMNKWLKLRGTQKATVEGTFRDFTVALNKPVAQLKNLTVLKGLKGRVTVDLASLDTGNPARDLNVTNTYFQVAKHPKATIHLDRIRTIATPENRLAREPEADITADGAIELHGVRRPLRDTQWHVSRRPTGILVTSLAPIPLASTDFSLPVTALLKVCKHLGLDDAAAVSISLLLQP